MNHEHFYADSEPNRSRLAIFRLASAQDGVIKREQLLGLGYSRDQILRMAQAASLRPLYAGVYAVGHGRFDAKSLKRAALLAAGAPAGLFRQTAATHLGLLDEEPTTLELVVPASRMIRKPDLYVHRSMTLDWRRDVAVFDGLLCTTVARTLVDLAGTLDDRELQRAAENAEYRKLLDYRAVAQALERAGRPKGAASLRKVLGSDRLGAALAGSGFERTVLSALRAAGTVEPILQQWFTLPSAERVRVDMYWPAARLVVEVDGPHHERPLFAAKDAVRDAGLLALGERVYRIPDRRWRREPDVIVAEILAALREL